MDNTPPTTSLSIGDPKYVVGGTFITSATPLNLSTADGGVTPVGVDTMEYRVDGGPWGAYSAPFVLRGDGVHAVEMQSWDLLGNEEGVVTIGIIVDDTAPTTTISPATGPFTVQTAFTLSATDAGSGVARTEYGIDGGAASAYGTPFTVPGGSHRIAYRSEDHLENLEPERTLDVWVESSLPPVTVLIVGQPKWDALPVYVTSATALSFSATDRSTLGLRRTMYRVDGISWINYTANGPFRLSGETEHLLEWYSEDFAGNVELTGFTILRVDDSPPAIGEAIGEPKYLVGGNFVTSATLATLQAVDQGAMPVGLASFDVRIDAGTWTPYLAPLKAVGPDGLKRVEYTAADRLGNRGSGVLELILDDTAPVTAISPGAGQASLDTVFTLAAADSGSGVARSEYRIDGGAWRFYAGGFALGPGDHLIGYRSVDHLNNTERESTVAVFVAQPRQPPPMNWKPVLAAMFSIVLLAGGASSAVYRSRAAKRTRRGAGREFAATTLPFVASELATGVISCVTGWLAIPPVVGLGFAVDLAILIGGLVILVRRAKSRAPSRSARSTR